MVVWTSDICHFYDDLSSFSHAMYLLASKASGRWCSMDNPHIGSIGICDQSRLETQCTNDIIPHIISMMIRIPSAMLCTCQ